MMSAALRHPIRVRALEWMNNRGRGKGREISATMFVNQGLGRAIAQLQGSPPQVQVTDVSYHLKELEKAGAIYETRSEPRRGGTERFYRARAVAYFSDEEWADTPLDRRREISRVVGQGLVVQMEGAIMARTFDSREDRWLLWEPKDLDEQGWSEMTTAIASFHAEASHIGRDAERRLEAEGAGARIHTTFGVVLFESPDLPDLPAGSDDGDS